MRQMIHIIALSLAIFFGSTFLVAVQGQKIGYINTEVIIQHLPEYDGAQQQLQQLSDEWKDKLDKMEEEIKELKEEFKTKKILFTEEIRTRKEQLIQQKVEARKQFMKQKFGPEGEYFKKQKKLLEPIQQKIYTAIISVSERLNIDFVFDRAKDSSLLYARNEWNLNKEILSELGVALN